MGVPFSRSMLIQMSKLRDEMCRIPCAVSSVSGTPRLVIAYSLLTAWEGNFAVGKAGISPSATQEQTRARDPWHRLPFRR